MGIHSGWLRFPISSFGKASMLRLLYSVAFPYLDSGKLTSKRTTIHKPTDRVSLFLSRNYPKTGVLV